MRWRAQIQLTAGGNYVEDFEDQVAAEDWAATQIRDGAAFWAGTGKMFFPTHMIANIRVFQVVEGAPDATIGQAVMG